MQTATCHTPGCENENIPLEVDLEWIDDNGDTQLMACSCGPCGQPITDITDGETEPEPEPPVIDNELPTPPNVIDNELPIPEGSR